MNHYLNSLISLTKTMKEVGFDVRHNDYPDYQYYIHNAAEIKRKIK